MSERRLERVRELDSCENLLSDGTPLLPLMSADFTCAGGPDGAVIQRRVGLWGFRYVVWFWGEVNGFYCEREGGY